MTFGILRIQSDHLAIGLERLEGAALAFQHLAQKMPGLRVACVERDGFAKGPFRFGLAVHVDQPSAKPGLGHGVHRRQADRA